MSRSAGPGEGFRSGVDGIGFDYQEIHRYQNGDCRGRSVASSTGTADRSTWSEHGRRVRRLGGTRKGARFNQQSDFGANSLARGRTPNGGSPSRAHGAAGGGNAGGGR